MLWYRCIEVQPVLRLRYLAAEPTCGVRPLEPTDEEVTNKAECPFSSEVALLVTRRGLVAPRLLVR